MARNFDRPLDWLRVRDPSGLDRIAKFLKGRGCNTFNGPKPDRKGDWIILIGYDARPDSDWGRFQGHSCAIWFASEELADRGEQCIRKAWGWATDDAESVSA